MLYTALANNKEKTLILCIETATEVCSVALSLHGTCIAEKHVQQQNAHGTELTALAENILLENSYTFHHLAAVAYSHGPGSYTGLRIGLSVAKGLCYALDIPLIEIPTLQHISIGMQEISGLQDRYFFPMLDARRLEVYAALLSPQHEFIIPPFACIVDEYDWEHILKDKKIIFAGNGLQKSLSFLQHANAVHLESYMLSAGSMCSLAYRLLQENKTADVAYAVPFYLKDARITDSKKKPL